MKQFKLLCVVLLFISIHPEKIKAQSSLAIPYQAVARDQYGNAISNHAISVRFSILDSSSTGPVIYSETDMVTTNEFGLFTVEIGRAIAATTGIFDPTKWKVLSSFVKTEMDTSGGSNFTDMGTTQIFCVPFAAYAETAGSVAGAATKQYVDAADALKADKVTGATLNDIALLDASGNLVDGGKKLSDYLTKDNVVPFVPIDDYNPATKKYADSQFANLIDSYIHRTEDGVYIYKPTPGIKRFGIGITTPESPLGIRSENDSAEKVISMQSSDGTRKWCFALKASDQASSGFSIDETVGGMRKSRLFIDGGTGRVSVNKITDRYILGLSEYNADGRTVLGISNDAVTTSNSGWSIGHLHNSVVPGRNGSFSISEEPILASGTASERITILPGGNLGIGESEPDVALHVSRPLSDPTAANGLDLGTGIAVFGPMTDNIVLDYKGIQARSRPQVSFGTIYWRTAKLNLQKLGGDILFHGDDTIPLSSKAIFTGDGKLGLGTIIPIEKIDVDGAIKIGTTSGLNDGTIRWTGTDFEGRKGGTWVSMTSPGLTINQKADKVVGSTIDNIAILDASGNLVDGGKKLSDYLTKDNSLSYTPTGDYNPATKKYVDDHASLSIVPNGTAIGQTLHWDGAAWVADSGIYSNGKRFGIGVTTPASPLGIKGEDGGDDQMISFFSSDNSQKWNINLNPSNSVSAGLSIIEDRYLLGLKNSRVFIQQHTGRIGIGTLMPSSILEINDSIPGDVAGMKIKNTAASSVHPGWLLGHFQSSSVIERNGSFSVSEERAGGKVERITVLPQLVTPSGTFKNVGINEKLPYATLHVSRPPSDPLMNVDLAENTGILLLGQIDQQNLGFDSHQIQARTGAYVGGTTTLSFAASTLGLQPRGGDILFHSESSSDKLVVITDNGLIGVGKTPVERLDVNGAITIGDASSLAAADGTIRWTGTDFEGRKGGIWKSLTTQTVTDGIWTPSGMDVIYYEPVSNNPKVGIGTTTPSVQLEVSGKFIVGNDRPEISGTSIAGSVTNQSSTSGTGSTDNRVGLNVSTSGQWSSNASAKNIGLYVSNVSGQASAESNIAAVINGNVVVGGMASPQVIGANGTNVLAIQTGMVPSSHPGTTATGGIQIYSDDLVSGSTGTPSSVFHLMNGDGTVIKLYRESALTAPDNSTIGTTYGTTESDVIKNMRERINQLESKLQALGLLH